MSDMPHGFDVNSELSASIPGLEGLDVSGLIEKCLAKAESAPVTGERVLGAYRLYEELGRGGMGVVYRAENHELQRTAAVKLLLAGEFARLDLAKRFKQEAQMLARLRHPHIVTVYEIGDVDGLPYFAMEYVKGDSLQTGWPAPVDYIALADFMIKVARAVDYAHGLGVLHRDLKPSNILRDEKGEPRITDFGLARFLTNHEADDAGITRSIDVLGSPPYMSPEQTKSNHEQVNHLTDVYSLGGVLYFLLTKRAPFQGKSLVELLKQVVEDRPMAPRLLDKEIPRDLETITLKCLEKDPRNRYQSAADFADDLEHFTKGEPIHARPLNLLGKACRWTKIHPVITWGFAALSLAAGVGIFFYQTPKSRPEIAAKNAKEKTMEFEHYEWTPMLFSDDGKYVISYTVSDDLTPKSNNFWDLSAGNPKLIKQIQPKLGIIGFVKGSSNSTAWVWGNSNRFRHYTIATDELQDTDIPSIPGRGIHAGLSPDGDYLFSMNDKGRVTVVSITDRVQLLDYTFSFKAEINPELSRNGQYLGICGGAGELQIINLENKNVLELKGHQYAVNNIAFSSDGKRLASVGSDSKLKIWDTSTGKELFSTYAHHSLARDVDWSPDDQTIATICEGEGIKLWDANTLQMLKHWPREDTQYTVKFSPDRKWLTVGTKSPDGDGKKHVGKVVFLKL